MAHKCYVSLQSGISMQECRERDVFDAVAAWAYGINGADSGSLAQSRADIEGLLLLIRFPLMTPSELQVTSSVSLCPSET